MLKERENILEYLVPHLYSLSFVQACWEGGSAATQKLDQYSDLDLRLVVADHHVDASFLEIEKALLTYSPIEYQRREPEPTWHGHSHSFYKLRDHSAYFFLDILIMKASAPDKLLDIERHGKPVIYFDKLQIIQLKSANTEEFEQKRKKRVEDLISYFPFLKIATLKSIRRKQPLDAFARYQHLLNCLVEVWGMKYRPLRYDFGLRYTYSDFPKAIQSKLEGFCFSANMQILEKNVKEIEKCFFEVISELKAFVH